MRDLHRAALLRAEAEHLLELFRLARPLSAEKRKRWVRGHHGALFGAQKVAWVLSREHERSVVFADPAREADDEAADGRILEQEAELIDHQHAPTVLAFDARPQCLGQQEMDGGD